MAESARLRSLSIIGEEHCCRTFGDGFTAVARLNAGVFISDVHEMRVSPLSNQGRHRTAEHAGRRGGSHLLSCLALEGIRNRRMSLS